jgi:cell division protease FtsH
MKEKTKKLLTLYGALLLVMVATYILFDFLNTKVNNISYGELIKEETLAEISKIEITPRNNAGVYEIRGQLKSYSSDEYFYVRIPFSEEAIGKLLEAQTTYGFELKTIANPEANSLINSLLSLIPFVILMAVAFYFISKQAGSANKSMDFVGSKAKLNKQTKKVTFDNVAGLDEEKEEVEEIIDFLKTPKKFQSLGARIPKGVLLVGPPGTGKTLLARAVAGEAEVPFFFISGSDFVELFVGVGASRVREMFKQAKASAPCLVFIDEIDAVGRQRGAGFGGGHDEREQTLNQLLTEMDGFGANEGIIIIAATNRPDVLDPALLRPGRFDRQITVNLPDIKGREAILQVHAKGKKISPNVSLENVARRTVGFSGADLENLLNEAALLAVRLDKKSIEMSDINEAHDRVLMGPAKKSKKYTEYEKKLVAYHEAGHVVLGLKLNDANDVQKVTIIPRGYAGGYAMMLPKEEKYTSTKKELLERIAGLLGGRVSEEIVFEEITTGAHNDFEQATKIARAMVTEYGMSDLGPIQFEHPDSSIFLGRDYNKIRNFSTEVANEIDKEVRKIIASQYEIAKVILSENRELLDLVATTLVEKETLTKEQIDHLAEFGKLPDEEPSHDHETLDELKKEAKEKKIKGYSKMNKEQLLKELGK